ncbi:hypothetical protein DLAC_06341 [Tieghemostelium lacteum]|uniref:Uncharacterized protein n=1 Tax=Tieghemostelium lacteum TaxID=361077 RepID=A0A151ZEP9_TIELA|nr:hypothetical protein DLAC_06341 [Tieghemostelium lacteum]|eukprot:KYQ92374.1 hypothetical protein DLAC_06341 [Tieghemostelium lacteum]
MSDITLTLCNEDFTSENTPQTNNSNYTISRSNSYDNIFQTLIGMPVDYKEIEASITTLTQEMNNMYGPNSQSNDAQYLGVDFILNNDDDVIPNQPIPQPNPPVPQHMEIDQHVPQPNPPVPQPNPPVQHSNPPEPPVQQFNSTIQQFTPPVNLAVRCCPSSSTVASHNGRLKILCDVGGWEGIDVSFLMCAIPFPPEAFDAWSNSHWGTSPYCELQYNVERKKGFKNEYYYLEVRCSMHYSIIQPNGDKVRHFVNFSGILSDLIRYYHHTKEILIPKLTTHIPLISEPTVTSNGVVLFAREHIKKGKSQKLCVVIVNIPNKTRSIIFQDHIECDYPTPLKYITSDLSNEMCRLSPILVKCGVIPIIELVNYQFFAMELFTKFKFQNLKTITPNLEYSIHVETEKIIEANFQRVGIMVRPTEDKVKSTEDNVRSTEDKVRPTKNKSQPLMIWPDDMVAPLVRVSSKPKYIYSLRFRTSISSQDLYSSKLKFFRMQSSTTF